MFSSSMSWRRKVSKIVPVADAISETHIISDDNDWRLLDTLSTEDFVALELREKYSLDPSVTSRIIAIIDYLKTSKRQLVNMSATLANASLSLASDFVVFITAEGTFISSNKNLKALLGTEVSVGGHVSSWLDGELLRDVLKALTTAEPARGTCAVVASMVSVSYDILAVNEAGIMNGVNGSGGVEALVLVVRQLPAALSQATDDSVALAASLVKAVLDQDPSKRNAQLYNISTSLERLLGAQEIETASLPVLAESAAEGTAGLLQLLEAPTGEDWVGDMDSWSFDVMEFKDKAQLRGVVGLLFQRHFDLAALQVDPRVFASFLYTVQTHYHNNPFHNFFHVTAVTHVLMLLVRATGADKVISPAVLFATAVSAIVHDIDHPGHNNTFEINAGSEISSLYGEKSVLENHHIATTFRLLRRKGTDIFAGMEVGEVKKLKKVLVSNIIATDMERHFILVERIKKIALLPEPTEGDAAAVAGQAVSRWDFSSDADSAFYCRIMLHAADLSNPVRPFKMSEFWSRCISDEFNNQVRLEKSMGLPFMDFMIIEDERALCKGEIGFASFVVAPMWRAIVVVFPALEHLDAQLSSNLETWKDRMAKLD